VSTAFKEVLNMKEVFTTNLLLINGLYRRQNFFLLSSPVRDEEEKQRRTTGDEKRKKLSNIYISLLLIELTLLTSFNSQTSLKAIGSIATKTVTRTNSGSRSASGSRQFAQVTQ